MSETVSPIQDAWSRIRKWFEANLPELDRDQLAWGAPASDQSLIDLGKVLRRKLPEAFRDSYRLYDGHGTCAIFELGGTIGETMSIDGVRRALDMKKQMLQTLKDEYGLSTREELAEYVYGNCDSSIKRRPWSTKWLPFADSGSGDYLCIDFDPAEHGVAGQIIFVDHETGPENVVASSFESLVLRHANDLERGAFIFDVDAGQIKRVVK